MCIYFICIIYNYYRPNNYNYVYNYIYNIILFVPLLLESIVVCDPKLFMLVGVDDPTVGKEERKSIAFLALAT